MFFNSFAQFFRITEVVRKNFGTVPKQIHSYVQEQAIIEKEIRNLWLTTSQDLLSLCCFLSIKLKSLLYRIEFVLFLHFRRF